LLNAVLMTVKVDEDDDITGPVPAADRHCRVVLRFVRNGVATVPLFRLEKALREAAEGIESSLGQSIPVRGWRFRTKDGWCAADPSPELRLAASRSGRLQLSRALPLLQLVEAPQGRMRAKIKLGDLHTTAVTFSRAIDAYHWSLFGSSSHGASVDIELREVDGVALEIHAMQESGAPTIGVCPEVDLFSGGFECAGNPSAAIASCLCELAIQFRGSRGGVGISHHQLATSLGRESARAAFRSGSRE
jgi:hypothetical protein